MLIRTNPYIQHYKHAFEVLAEKPEGEQDTLHVRLRVDPTNDQQCYNQPTANEIAVIIPSTGAEEASDHRDIIL